MFNKTHTLIALAASAALGAGVLFAADSQNTAESPTASDNNASNSPTAGRTVGDHGIMDQLREIAKDPNTAGDKLFLLNTDIDNTAEIRLNQKVSQIDSDSSIKQLAEHMVTDHKALQTQLDEVAKELNVTLPHEVPAAKAEEGRILTSMDAKNMERAYLAHMYVAHVQLIACFEDEEVVTSNPKLQQLTKDTLPTLKAHKAMIEQVAGGMSERLTTNTPESAVERQRDGTARPGPLPNAPVANQQ